MCFAKRHNTVKQVRLLEPTTPQSRVKRSTTEPLHSHSADPDKTASEEAA